MNITVNGETRQVPAGTTAAALIEALGLGGRRLALEVNGEIVPKSEHQDFTLTADDRVEIVHAVGGG
ncbi:MAG: thiamine biosynthesis protein ThiS [Gammaproteobacteria bacterium SG8_31]|jgi:sulfur carrier protein|nr:MAG: thiamine biosynthesis protein ThiS [Gammaproteobacteria bacterium SG8_31]